MNTSGISTQTFLDSSSSLSGEKKSKGSKGKKDNFSELLNTSDESNNKPSEIRKNNNKLSVSSKDQELGPQRDEAISKSDAQSKAEPQSLQSQYKNENSQELNPSEKSFKKEDLKEGAVESNAPLSATTYSLADREIQSILNNKMTKESIGIPSTSDLHQRLAMKNFLFKMQKDLDIHPEKLIEAFSHMSVEQLMSPPEESMGDLLSQLDLNSEQLETAKLYFNEMLQQTASSSMADYLKEKNSDISIQVLSKKELQDRQIQKDISSLSNNFFVQNQLKDSPANKEAVAGMAAGMALVQQNDGPDNFFAKPLTPDNRTQTSLEGVDISGMELLDEPVALNSSPTNENSYAPNFATRMESQLGDMDGATPGLDSADGGIDTIENLMQELNVSDSDPISFDFEAGGDDAVQNIVKTESSTPKVEGPVMSSASLDGAGQDNEDSESSEYDDGLYSQQMDGLQGKDNKNQGLKNFVINSRPQPTDAENASNVKEVINSARMMVKNGGGEMKVQMNPHGLGEVTMKVNVENGNVNVEMLADSMETKKIIEKGIGELKHTLASHKLNVENIKIETPSNLLGDMTDKQNEAERQFAQQFMGEFRRNNESWRNGFLGFTGARAYASQTQGEAQNPLLQVNSNKRSASSRRLDLVA